MSNEKKNGGPAFPNAGEHFIEGVHGIQPQSAYGMQGDPGMTLRDYFAAKAMQGLCMAYGNPDLWPDDRNGTDDYDVVALHAYTMADAMIKAREQ